MIMLFAYIVVAVLLGYLTIYFLKTLAPEHPKLVDNIVWAVVLLFVILLVANAIGLSDVPVPKLRH